MRITINQKVIKEVDEQKEMELTERYVLKVWSGNTVIDMIEYTSQPTEQEISEVLYIYRNRKDCEATLHKLYKLVEETNWEELK